MQDYQKVVRHCREAHEQGREISDACVRVIASLYCAPKVGATSELASTGAIADEPDALWRDLFGGYIGMDADERTVADMTDAYLRRRGMRGPVPGWSTLWL